MSFDLDPELICRDENCKRVELHEKHPVLTPREIRPQHRPDPTKKPLWRRDDPRALTGAVARAVPKGHPTHFAAIHRDVQDDYGPCSERSVYRHLAKLVQRGHLIKLDLGLSFAAYIRPKARMLRDREALREYMFAIVEMHPTTKDQAPGADHVPHPARKRAVAAAKVTMDQSSKLVNGEGNAPHREVRFVQPDEERAIVAEFVGVPI